MKTKAPSKKFRIAMLIDDNELDNFLNQKILEGNHFAEKIYVNTGGRSALEFLKNLSLHVDIAGQILPDVIFVDINMPLMDGFQFISQYEKFASSLSKKSNVVILTTSINPEDKARAASFKSKITFLTKPLTDEMLLVVEENAPAPAV
jgi:CheY-like chemotaxis protein